MEIVGGEGGEGKGDESGEREVILEEEGGIEGDAQGMKEKDDEAAGGGNADDEVEEREERVKIG